MATPTRFCVALQTRKSAFDSAAESSRSGAAAKGTDRSMRKIDRLFHKFMFQPCAKVAMMDG
jgi:hypothetical protein